MLVSWVHLNCCIGKSAGYLCIEPLFVCMRAPDAIVLMQSQAAFRHSCVCMPYSIHAIGNVLVWKKGCWDMEEKIWCAFGFFFSSFSFILNHLFWFSSRTKLISKWHANNWRNHDLVEKLHAIFIRHWTKLKWNNNWRSSAPLQSINHHIYLLLIHLIRPHLASISNESTMNGSWLWNRLYSPSFCTFPFRILLTVIFAKGHRQ